MENIYILIAIWVVGTLMHFLYDFTGKNKIVGLFAPINESVWEHYKLVFYPVIFAGFYLAGQNGLNNMSVPIVLSVCHCGFMMFGIFYFYTAAFKSKPNLAVDIGNFFVTAGVGWHMLLKYSKYTYSAQTGMLGVVSLIILVILVWTLTYYPAKVPLFIDFSKQRK